MHSLKKKSRIRSKHDTGFRDHSFSKGATWHLLSKIVNYEMIRKIIQTFCFFLVITTFLIYCLFFIPYGAHSYTLNNVLHISNAKYYIENFPWILNNKTLLGKNFKLLKYSQPQIVGSFRKMDDCFFPEFDYKELAKRRHLYLFTFKNTYATTTGAFIKNGHFYFISHNCKSLAHKNYFRLSSQKDYSLPFKSYDIVVSLTHDNFGTFGHWLSEIYPEMFLLPKHVLQNGYIICKEAHPFHIEGYELIGFSRDRILSGPNLTVFGQTVYTFSCQTCMHLNPLAISFAKQEIIRILNLPKIEPDKFVLFNRLDSRRLANFDEIAHTVMSKYPHLNWIRKSQNNGTLTEQIRHWHTVKFIFGTHSSALFGCLFMQPNSIVAAVEWCRCFHSLEHLAVWSGLYFVHLREPEMTTNPYRIDLQLCVDLIETALKFGKVI